MEKRIRPVMLAACLLWLMPLSAWAASPPTVQVDGTHFIITGGFCEVLPSEVRVDLSYDEMLGTWNCDALGELEADATLTVSIDLQLIETSLWLVDECHAAGGILYQDICYIYGHVYASCRTTCSEAGGRYDPATATEIGSRRDGGSRQRCGIIASYYGLDGVKPAALPTSNRRMGCSHDENNTHATWYMDGPTTQGAKSKNMRRFCACQMEDD